MPSEPVTWAAIVAVISFAGTIGGWVWRLSTRLATSEAESRSAKTKADEAERKADEAGEALHKHQLWAAREYASQKMVEGMKRELLDAIAGLGTRIDNLFRPHSG
jgi:hypothetical protein